jgi:D-glycero-D-manno-heptose 1,7-bisphosphate phosphatase
MCRKPEPGMLLQAAIDFDIDLERSWFIGDILDDIEAGNRAGSHTILVDVGMEKQPTTPLRVPSFVAPTLRDALELVLAVSALESEQDIWYRPESWKQAHEGTEGIYPGTDKDSRPLVWRAV